MNVLLLTSEFMPIRGGVGAYAVGIARSLPKSVNICIVTPRDAKVESSNAVEELPSNVTIHEIDVPKSIFLRDFVFQLRCKSELSRLIRNYDVDIVHSQSDMPDFLVSAGEVSRPTVTTVHSTLERHYRTIRKSAAMSSGLSSRESMKLTLGPLMTAIENAYYTNDRNYISVSEWGRRELAAEKGIDLRKIRAIHNGVDTEKYHPTLRERPTEALCNLRDLGSPIVLFLARLEMRKGITQFLRAIPRIRRNTGAHFIIAGSGHIPSPLRDTEGCTYLGQIPHAETPYLYALSDIFVLPSLSENLPISILEAMASEVAVVATRICGIPEIIDHEKNGLLIRPNSADDIAEAVERLAESEDYRKSIARNGRSTVVERFQWKETIKKTVKYYEDILTSNSH